MIFSYADIFSYNKCLLLLLSATRITAFASLGIAFSFPPPVISTSLKSHSLCRLAKTEAKSLIALVFCLWISAPECPPIRPLTLISYVSVSSLHKSSPDWLFSVYSTGISHCALTPPAQLTYNTPSDSESIFISILAVRSLVSSSLAPSIPISSSLVSTAWIGGWAIVSDARIARI